ncbi:MAG: DUF5719 family protein [Actinomycetia bacterium]|nr:DUF5719 family protein [Actinomycetes bacterium]
MNPRLLPAFLALLLSVVLGLGLSALGSQQRPSLSGVTVTGTHSVVCPVMDPALVTTTVRAAAGGGARARLIGESETRPVPASGVPATRPDPYVVVGDQTVAGIATGAAGGGPMRGLWLASCGAATVEQVFPGLVSDADHRSFLVLTNPDPNQATVDISLYGSRGRIQAQGSRGVTVLGNSSRLVALEPLVTDKDPLTAVVRTSAGRVFSYARVEGQGGADWVTSAAPAATSGIITGIPGGSGARTLVLANPGDRRTTVTVEAMTQNGSFAPAGADQVDVSAESTVTVALDKALLGETAGLRIRSTQPVTGAVWAATADGTDLAVASTRRPFAGRSVLPVVPGGVLTVSNAGGQEAPLTLTVRDSSGAVIEQSTQAVPAGTTQQLPLTTGDTVQVDSPSDQVGIAVVSTGAQDRPGLGIAPLGPGGLAEAEFSPQVDPALA